MGLRIRKSIKLGKNTRLNISKSGLSVSTGIKGARISYNPKYGVRESVGIPGTGIYYTKQHKIRNTAALDNSPARTNIEDIKKYNNLTLNKLVKRLFIKCVGFIFLIFLLDAFTFRSNVFFYILFALDMIYFIYNMIKYSKQMFQCNKNKVLM